MKTSIILLSVGFLMHLSGATAQTLTFKYDDGRNQVVRSYCDVCSHMQKTGIQESQKIVDGAVKEQFDVKIYPNPTKDKVTLVWSKNTDLLLQRIEYVAYNFTQFRSLEFKKGSYKAILDLTDFPIGLYVVIFHLSNGERLTYKILKH